MLSGVTLKVPAGAGMGQQIAVVCMGKTDRSVGVPGLLRRGRA